MSKTLDDSRADILKSIEAGHIKLDEKPPHPDSLLLRRGVLRLSKERAADFHRDLIDLITRYQDEDDTPDDPYYALLISLYPTAFPYGEGDEEEQ